MRQNPCFVGSLLQYFLQQSDFWNLHMLFPKVTLVCFSVGVVEVWIIRTCFSTRVFDVYFTSCIYM